MSQDDLNQIKERAKSELFFLTKNILGYSRLSEEPHREICDFLTNKHKKKKLLLAPRGSFKSSIVTIAKTIFTILNDPNARILIVSETQKNAKTYFREIKEHLQSNQKLITLFSDLSHKAPVWREEELTVNSRTKIYKEPTIMYSSLEKQVTTGLHFSHIIMDDVVSPNNINSVEQTEKTLSYYKYLNSVLDPGSTIDVVGTRYSAIDLYSFLMDKDFGEGDQFDVLVKSALDKDGNPTMPSILSKEFLETQKKTQGDFIFATQYLNEALNRANTAFNQSQIQYFDKIPENVKYFITHASAEDFKSNFSAVIVVAVDQHNNYYVEEAIEDTFNTSQLNDLIIKLIHQYKPQAIGLAKWVIEKLLKHSIYERMESEKVFTPIIDLSTDSQLSKEQRIRALHPKFENKEIFLKRSQKLLINQVIYYPQTKRDHLLAALSNQLNITFPADAKDKNPPKDLSKLSTNEQRVWKHVQSLANPRRMRGKWTRL